MTAELLQQVRVLDPEQHRDEVADILLVNGMIADYAPQVTDYPETTQVRDCRGLILGPGLVDCYSHSNEPGYESRETLADLAASAIAGGFTRLTLLPDTEPPLDSLGELAGFQSRRQYLPGVRLSTWAALTHGLKGEQMTELAELATGEIVGFSDGKPLENLALLHRALEYLQPLGKPVALCPCSPALAREGVMREGSHSLRLGMPGIPVSAETTALAAILEIVATTATPVHIMRVSTARSVELLRQAQLRGIKVTASTPWLHLLLSTTDLAGYNPNLHLQPPLGNLEDRQALREGVQSGVLQAIAIDHHAYSYEEKTVAFAEAPPGAIGLEFALPLLWQQLVTPGTWTALELWQALSSGPARCLSQAPAKITPGQPAELTLFDPSQQWQVEPTTLKTPASNTAYFGQTVTGRVVQTWCA